MIFRSRKAIQLDMLLRPYKNKLHPSFNKNFQNFSKQPQPLLYSLHPRQTVYGKPLGPLSALPFNILRSNSGNLPVYYKYSDGYRNPKTIIRKIEGDVERLVEQVRKVVSNHQIRVKVGSIEIKGKHKESLHQWLYRVGF